MRGISVGLSLFRSVLLVGVIILGGSPVGEEGKALAEETVLPVTAAESDDGKISRVEIHIRTLMAGNSAGFKTGQSKQIDPAIRDLGSKLNHLRYNTFRLLSEKSTVVPILKRKVVNLSDGYKLAVRPLYMTPEKIGLWVRWKDREGVELIDTRLHFEARESLLTGVDMPNDRGVILAVQVRPASQ